MASTDKTLVLQGTTLSQVAPDLAAAGWEAAADGNAIEKRFEFTGFPQAMSFMLTVAFEAEDADHHPEWRNVYNRVDVCLTSHDANGVTERDLALARAMQRIYKT